MFGVSFTELMLIGAVALIVVGPQRLPSMMATVGKWSSKMRRMLFDVRQQSGIDDILRAEGITGGINEIRALRNAVRGNVQSLAQTFTRPGVNPAPSTPSVTSSQSSGTTAVVPPVAATPLAVESDPYTNVPYDRSREYPDEGCDAYGAIPDDLWAATQRPVKPVEPEPDVVTPEIEATSTALAEGASPDANSKPGSPAPELNPSAADADAPVVVEAVQEPSAYADSAARAHSTPSDSTHEPGGATPPNGLVTPLQADTNPTDGTATSHVEDVSSAPAGDSEPTPPQQPASDATATTAT